MHQIPGTELKERNKKIRIPDKTTTIKEVMLHKEVEEEMEDGTTTEQNVKFVKNQGIQPSNVISDSISTTTQINKINQIREIKIPVQM